jgi:hypothetical protein
MNFFEKEQGRLAVGKAPLIYFTPLVEIISAESEKISPSETPPLNQVAEPVENYKRIGK